MNNTRNLQVTLPAGEQEIVAVLLLRSCPKIAYIVKETSLAVARISDEVCLA